MNLPHPLYCQPPLQSFHLDIYTKKYHSNLKSNFLLHKLPMKYQKTMRHFPFRENLVNCVNSWKLDCAVSPDCLLEANEKQKLIGNLTFLGEFSWNVDKIAFESSPPIDMNRKINILTSEPHSDIIGMQHIVLFPHQPLYSLLLARGGEFFSKMVNSHDWVCLNSLSPGEKRITKQGFILKSLSQRGNSVFGSLERVSKQINREADPNTP